MNMPSGEFRETMYSVCTPYSLSRYQSHEHKCVTDVRTPFKIISRKLKIVSRSFAQSDHRNSQHRYGYPGKNDGEQSEKK